MSGTGEIVREASSIVMLLCLFSPAVPAGRPITGVRVQVGTVAAAEASESATPAGGQALAVAPSLRPPSLRVPVAQTAAGLRASAYRL